MAARAEAEEDHHRGYGLPDNGVDALSDHDHENYRAKDLGSIQYLGYIKSRDTVISVGESGC